MVPQISDEAKSECVLWMHETKSPTIVRRKFQTKYGRRSAVPSRGIQDAVSTITNAMLAKTWKELMTRLKHLRDNGGRHVEILLSVFMTHS